MVKKAWLKALNESDIDCACVIHGSAYPWTYVEKLYAMLSRNFSRPVRLHVWTEAQRPVPSPYVKHCLQDWPGIQGPKKSWWYKMQMFDPRHFQGRLIYFDLDVIVFRNIDWMLELDPSYFWAVKDFRYLFRGAWLSINSSIMIWHNQAYSWIWDSFQQHKIDVITRRFAGDQDFLNSVLDSRVLRYIDSERIRSWRWEVKDGGMDFKKRIYTRPDAGSVIPPTADILVFHGHPKPHEIAEKRIQDLWQ
jgi:lipopolysaccharide biosynthesis glycosyltransferase